ncbi:HAT dimerization domain C-terminal [Pyrenophora tritici-repentis]|nr:HAT dimerization domain C-terminal [Pyrenophora tritici-repentis]
MPVAKEQVGDVPEGLVPAIKLEPPPGFEQDEWEQLTDGFACEADEIDGILDQREEWDILSEKRFTQKKSVAKDILAIPIAQVGVERVFNVAKDVIGSRRHRLSARTIQQIMVLKDTISQEEEQGLDYLLPASLEHTFDIDEENQTTEEESEEEVQEERQLPPRKRQRPQRYRDN